MDIALTSVGFGTGPKVLSFACTRIERNEGEFIVCERCQLDIPEDSSLLCLYTEKETQYLALLNAKNKCNNITYSPIVA